MQISIGYILKWYFKNLNCVSWYILNKCCQIPSQFLYLWASPLCIRMFLFLILKLEIFANIEITLFYYFCLSFCDYEPVWDNFPLLSCELLISNPVFLSLLVAPYCKNSLYSEEISWVGTPDGSVKHLTSVQVMIWGFLGWSPALGSFLSWGSFCPSLSAPPHTHAPCLLPK